MGALPLLFDVHDHQHDRKGGNSQQYIILKWACLANSLSSIIQTGNVSGKLKTGTKRTHHNPP